MLIRVTDTEKRSSGNGASYVAYNVETEVNEAVGCLQKGHFDVWRRFSEFVALRDYLRVQYPAVVSIIWYQRECQLN